MEQTRNDKLAAQVGQDKPKKDGSEASDAETGTYSPQLPELATRNLTQAQSTVSPFGSVRKV